MVKANFLLEIGTEELPAGQIFSIVNHIKKSLEEIFTTNDISFKSFVSFCTPRRLVFFAEDLLLLISDKEIEIKGPPENIAKDVNGNLSQATLGFLKKNELEEKNVFFKDNYLFAKKSIKGQSSLSLIQEKFPEIISSTQGTRFMRWGNGELKFARPIQWLLAGIDKENDFQIIDLSIENIKASNSSRGHRFLHPEVFTVTNSKDYFHELESRKVILDINKRKQKIIEETNSLALKLNAQAIFDDRLLEEIALITEYPSAVLCDFNPRFLKVPDCVLKTVMINHQRYLPLSQDGRLLEKFITISNNPLLEAYSNIKSGNEKVIVPRFKDAEFFVEEDTKTSLASRIDKLEKLNFLKGNMLQKAKRLQKIVTHVADKLKDGFENNPRKAPQDRLDDLAIEELSQAALLAKTDLTTNLVFEFTELQGQIGGIYAQQEGLKPIIYEAIADHYHPRFSGDSEPNTIGGKILSLADKLDNIICAFALGKIPSGSADPFALRRQANAVLEIVIHNNLLIDLDKLIDFVISLQKTEFGDGEIIKKIKGRGDQRKEVSVAELDWQNCYQLVSEFLESRLPFVFEIYHHNASINKAVLASGNALSELNTKHMMIHFLNDISQNERFKELVESISRIINIAQGSNDDKEIDDRLFESDYEKFFLASVKKLELNGKQKYSYEPLLNVHEVLGSIKVINDFFDNVLVNSENQKTRQNRLALLGYASKVFSKIGDFSLLKN